MPYKGAAPAVNDLAGGHVDTMFCDLGTILSLHRADRVRIIAAVTPKRIALLPDIPTIDESALPGFVSTTFFSLMAPPGTPREIREKLNKAIVAAMRTPEVQEKLKSIFVEASDLDVAAMDRVHQVRGQALGRRDPGREDHRRAVVRAAYCAASLPPDVAVARPRPRVPLVSADGCGIVMML